MFVRKQNRILVAIIIASGIQIYMRVCDRYVCSTRFRPVGPGTCTLRSSHFRITTFPVRLWSKTYNSSASIGYPLGLVHYRLASVLTTCKSNYNEVDQCWQRLILWSFVDKRQGELEPDQKFSEYSQGMDSLKVSFLQILVWYC